MFPTTTGRNRGTNWIQNVTDDITLEEYDGEIVMENLLFTTTFSMLACLEAIKIVLLLKNLWDIAIVVYFFKLCVSALEIFPSVPKNKIPQAVSQERHTS
ncbi:hypothetical protein OUZ56_005910 [Daphnia magna]|uniref:Uncharacterized protein n=1 Tax=Daphnia magna TaxID=35525 RepID=A0ABQ9YVH4_9CRUS|nr:hypothetical protein OUZ56_005910 [Daphnia magna]